MGFPGGAVVKNPPASVGDAGDVGSIPGSGSWRRKWQPAPVFLPGEPHGQRSLVCYSPWGCKELDMTEYASNGWLPINSQSSLLRAEVHCTDESF